MTTNAEVVLAVIQAVQDRDVEALFSRYHADVEFHEAASLPYGGISRGREAMRRQLEEHPERTWLGTWGPLQPTEVERRFDPCVVAQEGEAVVAQYIQRALSPAGERFEAPVIGLYRVREGLFARAQMFHYDTAAVLGFLERAGSAGSDAA